MFAKIFPLLLSGTLLLTQTACQDEKSQPTQQTGKEGINAPARLDSLQLHSATQLDSFFQQKFRNKTFNGAVLFAEGNQIVYKKAFGYSDFRNKDTLSTSSAFQLASVTKPLTAYAIMLLYQQGKLDYQNDIRRFFPDFPYENITIQLLLTHRSGLPNYMYFTDKYWKNRHTPISNQDVINLMIEHQPLHYYKPDVRYNYSNTNYCLLAAIIETVSGQSFDVFMTENIFNPLGMNDTKIYYKSKDPHLTDVVLGYNKRGRIAEDSYLNGVVGDKGIYSTVEDLFRWQQAMANGTLVGREILEQAFQPAHPDLRIWDNYGFGWRIDGADPGRRVVYHSGWWKGFRSYFISKLDEEKTIIVLTNNIRRNYLSIRQLRALF